MDCQLALTGESSSRFLTRLLRMAGIRIIDKAQAIRSSQNYFIF